MEMKLRTADAGDAAAIAKVQVDSWRTTYRNIVDQAYLDNMKYADRERVWEKAVEQNPIFVLVDGTDEIVGFAVGGPERSGDFKGYDGELYAIYLYESVQGHGGGRCLVEAVAKNLIERGFGRMVIAVLSENPACRFYEKMGGHRIGEEEIEIGQSKHTELIYGFDELKSMI
ncbi:GNAT family N-acetyltransferase [Salinicoccus hispanicus]|uniref:GNAT family N-acetyltransferase n=1 Tax=Salinicoccus hispanicus TaxID=157225 RepID=A0A6N8U6Y6_9STAP|nr:GNAT family N-acetyltransferase [Salinicoccus hispanicus]MXQ52111.1 GNAT family N-acetyltransferase [Salinicoccus hispanicus]